MLLYKNKVKQNLQSLSSAHIPKMAFILSRSQFPFEEIIFRDVLHDGIIRRSSNYEIGSLVPSLARSRFRNFVIIDKMCEDYVVSASKDVSKSFSQPQFLKIFLERLIQLDYHRIRSEKSTKFFKQIKVLILQKLEEFPVKNDDPLMKSVENQAIDQLRSKLLVCLEYAILRDCYESVPVEKQQYVGELMVNYERVFQLKTVTKELTESVN